MSLFCMSVSHKSADVEIREKLVFSAEEQHRIMHEICALDSADECVILCTCSRTEIYFTGNTSAYGEIRRILSYYGGIDEELLSPYIMRFDEDKALNHLFRVACGIDSMVLGEDEILGQTKNAYISAQKIGTAKCRLNMIFQSAIACAKKIKTDTELSRTSVSTATLAANEAAKLGKSVNVLVIGASGKIGTTVLKNLSSHKNVKITAALRRNGILGIKSADRIKTVDYSERYDHINTSDCIISATSSPHFTVTVSELKKCIKIPKSRLFIDIAVPPDIDSAIVNIDGVKLIGIDYFEKLAAEHNALKLSSVDAAKSIINDETENLKKELYFREFLPYLEDFRLTLNKRPFEELLYKMKAELNSQQLKAVLAIFKEYKG